MGTRQRGRIPVDKGCSIASCEESGYARGLCVTHYRQALRRAKRRTFAEKVLVLWDQYDLDADSLGWGVDPDTEEIRFELWRGPDSSVILTPELFIDLSESLKKKKDVAAAYEEWVKAAA